MDEIFFGRHHFRREDEPSFLQFKLNILGISGVIFQDEDSMEF
jgi:hypothetical protein